MKNEGVSNVIGSILLFALFVAVMATIQTSYVPVWTEDSEASHMQEVGDQFADLRARLDQQAAGEETGSLTLPVNLGGNEKAFKFSMFDQASLPSSLKFEDAQSPVNLASLKLVLEGDDVNRNFVLDEDWQPLTNGLRFDDVDEVKHMRIRINDFDTLNGNSRGNKDAGYLEATVIDAQGNFGGNILITKETVSSDWAIWATVKSGTGAVIFDQLLVSAKHDIAPNSYYLNLLENDMFADAVMSAAEGPFDLVWTNDQLSAEIASTVVSGGITVGNTGYAINSYSKSMAGGVVRFDSRYNYLLDQDYVIENGAVIVDQGSHQAFSQPPSLSVSLKGTRTIVDWTIPTLTGASQDITGQGTSAVKLTGGTRTNLEAQAPNLAFTFTTSYPQLWEQWFHETLSASGLSETAGEYAITTAPNSVALNIYGTTAAPADTSLDINFNFSQRDITIELVP